MGRGHLLERTALFEGLTPDERDRLAALAVQQRFAAGDLMIEEGRRANRFYLIIDGAARVRIRDRMVATRHAGDWVGEAALVEDVRHASVEAETDVRVLSWKGNELLDALARNPECMQRVVTELGRRARDLVDDGD